jgi:hypothetical protein
MGGDRRLDRWMCAVMTSRTSWLVDTPRLAATFAIGCFTSEGGGWRWGANDRCSTSKKQKK